MGASPEPRFRLKSNGNADIQKVNAPAANATSGDVLVTALLTSAATATHSEHDEARLRLPQCGLRRPARVNMKFVNLKANEKDELPLRHRRLGD